MKKLNLFILIVVMFVTALVFYNKASAQANGNTGSTGSYSPFKVLNGIIQPQSTAWTLRMPYLSGCDTIDTDVNGNFVCGSDATGGGGAGNTFNYPFTPTLNYGTFNQATTGIAWFQNGLNASSTSHFVNASTSIISITGGLFGANLSTCNSTTGKLVYDSTTGLFGCGTDFNTGSGSSADFPFTVFTNYNATGTPIGFLAGLFSNSTTTLNGSIRFPSLSNGGLAVFSGLVSSGATTTAGTGLTYSGNAFNVNSSQSIATLSNLTTNGVVTTSGSNGTLGVTANSTGGLILAMSNGIPTWVSTTTFSGGLTYANGNVTCTGCGAAGNPDLVYLTQSGTAYYTASSTLSDNKSFYFGNGFVSNASSTIDAPLRLPTLSQGNLYIGSTGLLNTQATSTCPTFSTGLSYSGTAAFCLGGTNGNVTVNTSQNITTLSNLSTNGLVTTSGSNGTLGVTTNGTGGFVLSMANGIPTWVATTTFSGGLTYANGNVTNSGVTSIIAGSNIAVSGATGAVTISASNPFEIGTSSTLGLGQSVYVSQVGGKTILASVATGTVSASPPLSVTAGRSCLGGACAFSITQSGIGTDGYLSTTDWNTFNNKQASLVGTFSPNSVITSNSVGTLQATGTQLTVGNLIASSTTGTSQFGGALFSGAAPVAGLGTSNYQVVISRNINNIDGQLYLANTNMGANAVSSLTFGNGNSTNAGASSAYIGGVVFCGPNFLTAGFNGCPPNGMAMYNTDGGVAIGSLSRNPASSTVDFYAGNNGGFGNGGLDMTLRNSGGVSAGGNAYLGLGTTSPRFLFTAVGSTTPQIALGGTNTDNIFTMRGIGNNFYLSTSSPITFATSSTNILTVNANGYIGVASSTPGSLFAINNVVNFDPATTSFSSVGGINITKGCFSIASVCISGSAGGSTNPAGTGSELQYRLNGTTFGAVPLTGTVLTGTSAFVGHGTTTPKYLLQLASSTESQLALTTGLNDAQFLFRVSANSLTIATSSPTAFATTSVSNIFNLNQNGALCIGLGCTPMTTSGLYIRDQEGTGPTLYLGGNPGGDTDWQIKRAPNNDTVSNDRLGFGIGDIGNNPTEILTLNANYTAGIGTTTPNYGLLTLASSTVPQLILGDGVAGNGKLAFRLAGGYMYLATTTSQGLATSSPPIEVWNPNGFLGIGGTTTPGSLFSINNVANFDPATSTFSSTGGINLARGCFSIAGVCIGNVTAGAGITAYDAWTHAYGGMSASSSIFAFGTTTSRIFPLTVASSTVPQLSLGDGIAGNPQYTMRTAGGNFYLGTTTAQGLATSTVPFLTILNNGGFGINDSTPDATLEIVGAVSGSYFELSKTGDGDIFNVNSSGLVGIGTSTPPSLLTLNPTNAQLNSVNPILLIGTSTLSGASASGTYAAINSPNGFTGDYLNIQNNNTASIKVSQSTSGFGVFMLGTTTNSSVPGKEVISTSTTSQLTLNDGLGGTTPWNFRSVGGNFYLSTSSAISAATSTNPVFTAIVGTGGKAGNVGIGTSSPAFGFGVEGTMAINGLVTSTAGNAVCIVNTQLVNAGANTCVTSSKFTKNDIQDMTFEKAKSIVDQMNAVSFSYKDDGSKQYGFIAEEVEKIDPRLVDHASEDTLLDGHLFKKGDPVSVNYGNYTAVLTKYLQGVNGSSQSIPLWVYGGFGLLVAWNLYLTLRKKLWMTL